MVTTKVLILQPQMSLYISTSIVDIRKLGLHGGRNEQTDAFDMRELISNRTSGRLGVGHIGTNFNIFVAV